MRAEQPVELELVLAVDTSVSVDAGEFALQIAGLAAAFRDPSVVAAIEATGDLGIAVTLVQWAAGLQQRSALGWRHLRDAASAEAFAREIESSRRHFVGNGTDISAALLFAAKSLQESGFEGRRRVIDLSGDGRNNSGPAPARVRDLIVASGVVINGLAILDGDLALGRYFQANVIGGTAAFVLTANGFEDFAEAMRRKLLREILPPITGDPPRGPA